MTGQGQAEVSNPDQSPKGTERQAVLGSGQKTRKQKLETDRSKGKNAARLDKQNKLATETENTGINTLEKIRWKMGKTWRGWRQAQRQVKHVRV
jgi:hypothetical protein